MRLKGTEYESVENIQLEQDMIHIPWRKV